MGTNNLSTKNNGDVVDPDDPNQYKEAFDGDIVPRNSLGNPEDEAGSMGSTIYRWLKIFVSSFISFGDPDAGIRIEGSGSSEADGKLEIKIGDVSKVAIDKDGLDGAGINFSGAYKSKLIDTAGESTFTVPAGVKELRYLIIGGGGGGGAGSSGSGAGGGGGAPGAVAQGIIPAVPGDELTITVGAGGGGGDGDGGNGEDGGETSIYSFNVFGRLARAPGGKGGNGASDSVGGAGIDSYLEYGLVHAASGAGGDFETSPVVSHAGEPGETSYVAAIPDGADGGVPTAAGAGGGGGGSGLGIGGKGGNGAAATNGVGGAGTASFGGGGGGGGGGGAIGSTATGGVGGSGAPGYVKLFWIGPDEPVEEGE